MSSYGAEDVEGACDDTDGPSSAPNDDQSSVKRKISNQQKL